MVSTKTREYSVKMFSGLLTSKSPGEGVYYGQCHKCMYRTIRYRFAVKAETDVQEHLWMKHDVGVFVTT